MPGCRLLAVLRRFDWRVPLVLAWAVFLLVPAWNTGYISDDMFNSSAPGNWIHNGSSPFAQSVSEARTWMLQIGRINPLIYFLKNYTFWLLRDVFWYKTALVAATLVNLLFFYRLLKRLGASADLAALGCLLTAALFQFRDFADPLLSYNGLMQCLFLAVTLSLDFFHRFLTGGKWGWLAGAVLLYLLAALTYELTYLLWILHLGLLLTTRPTWARALSVAPFAAIPVLLTLGSLWLRALPGFTPGPYAMNLAPGAVADAALKQFVAALPGSYVGLDSTGRWHGVLTWQSLRAHPAALVLGFVGGALAAVGLARRPDDAPLLRRLLVLGLLLAVLPVPLIALVKKYQGKALGYGVGYLPVYFQYFGVALVVACGAAALAGRVRNHRAAVAGLAVVLGALCAGVAALHSEANARVAQAICVPYLHPRCEVEEVLERGGLLAGAPEGAVVVADAFLWDSFGVGTYFYCQHTRLHLKEVLPSVSADAAKLAELPQRPRPEGDGPPLLRVHYGPGFALAGKMSYLRSNANGVVTESGVRLARLAVAQAGRGRPARHFVLHAERVEFVGEAEVRRPVAVDSWRMCRAVDTDHWTVYNVDIPGADVLAESVWLEDEPPALASTAP